VKHDPSREMEAAPLATTLAGLSLLGTKTEYSYSNPVPEILEVFDNPRYDQRWVVAFECLEFSALCPLTGQPDFGKIWIEYVPDRLCVESKSLKLYLFSYRQHGAFHESCVNKIADDIAAKAAPRYLRVSGVFNVRGGIGIRVLAPRTGRDISPEEQDSYVDLLNQFHAVVGITSA
jgi:7-cyano-7-deazaguanine reductase